MPERELNPDMHTEIGRYSYPQYENAPIHRNEAEQATLGKLATLEKFEEIGAGQAVVSDIPIATYLVFHCQTLVLRHLERIGMAHILPNNYPEPFIDYMLEQMGAEDRGAIQAKLIVDSERGIEHSCSASCTTRGIKSENLEIIPITGKKDIIVIPTLGEVWVYTKKGEEILKRFS